MWARVQDPRHNFSSVADELKKNRLKSSIRPKIYISNIWIIWQSLEVPGFRWSLVFNILLFKNIMPG